MFNKKSKLKNFFLNLLIVLSICTFGAGCKPQITTIEASPSLAVISRGRIAQKITLIGQLEANQTSFIKWNTSGVVTSIHVSDGQKVKKGEVIAELEPYTESEEIISSEKEMVEIDEKIDELLISETAKAKSYKELRDKELALSEAEHYYQGLSYPVSDKEQVLTAEREMKEAKRLYDLAVSDYQSVILRDELDSEKKAKYKTLQDTLNDYAKKNDIWISYVSSPTKNQIDQAAAAIEVAKAAYATALETFKTYQASFVREKDLHELELSYESARKTNEKKFLVADIDGVASFDFAVGDFVTPTSESLRIDDFSEYRIAVDVAEYDFSNLKDGLSAEVCFDALPDKTYHGLVKIVSEQGTNSGSVVSFKTVVIIENPDEQLKTGMTAQVTVIKNEKESALLIPSSAFAYDQEQAYVEKMSPEGLTRIPVEIGLNNGIEVEILSGNLSEGDSIKIQNQ